jgi:hypothetical protein
MYVAATECCRCAGPLQAVAVRPSRGRVGARRGARTRAGRGSRHRSRSRPGCACRRLSSGWFPSRRRTPTSRWRSPAGRAVNQQAGAAEPRSLLELGQDPDREPLRNGVEVSLQRVHQAALAVMGAVHDGDFPLAHLHGNRRGCPGRDRGSGVAAHRWRAWPSRSPTSLLRCTVRSRGRPASRGRDSPRSGRAWVLPCS